jgi:exoribonuclease R
MTTEKTGLAGTSIKGTFYFGKNGVGFMRTPELDYAVEIPADKTGQALHKDKVIVEITDTDNTTGAVGRVIEVTKRDKHGYIGILEKRTGTENAPEKYIVEPKSRRRRTEGKNW